LLGTDLTGVNYDSETDFTGAFYDASTLFDPLFDTASLILVPEPSTRALLAFGLTALAFSRLMMRQPPRKKRRPMTRQGV
jgi:hypothetical protein